MELSVQVLLALIAVIGTFVTLTGSFLTLTGWLIRRQDEQNAKITDRFLTYMETSAVQATEVQKDMTSSLSEVTTALGQVTATLVIVRDQDRADHRDIIEAIGKIPPARSVA